MISTTIIIVLDINRQASINNSSYHSICYDTITNSWDSYFTNKT